jgi:hypothetical protein
MKGNSTIKNNSDTSAQKHKRKRSIIPTSPDTSIKKSKNKVINNHKVDNNIDSDVGAMTVLDRPFQDDNIDWNEWVAATATRNFLLDDGILDVLQNKGSTLTRVNTSYQDSFIKTMGGHDPKSFISTIIQQGNKFELEVYDLIVDKLGADNVINIGGDCNPRSKQKYLETIDAMNNGTPIIYQGVLRNYINKTYGIPDLLVRSDYLNRLVTKIPISSKETNKIAPKLIIKGKDAYHYVVIDIKFKTLHLKSDGIHLRNDGPMKAYKGQLCVYNQALGIIQGYEPAAAFILGWKWKYVCKNIERRGDNCFDLLGRIDYKGSDNEYIQKTQNAISWILKVRQEADNWDLSKIPLPYEELYPNMCNRYDFPHHKLKKKFAEDIEEISLIWKCGPKQRRIAHENGIYSWKDPRCTPEMLGIGGEYTSNIVARILEANRSNDQNIFPQYIQNNFADWKNPRHLEFFVDFEMTCSVFTEFDDLPWSDGESLIFMIGVGYICPETEKWIFRDFTLDRLDSDGEFAICSEFSNYINGTIKKYDCFDVPTFYHWSHAESSAWKRSINRHTPMSYRWYDFEWVDLLKVFQEEPIGIKGCLSYGLKVVAKAFYKLGYIKTIWDNGSSCADGADAAVGAYRIDKETRRKGIKFQSDPLAQEIIRYNEVDCKVLQEIIDYLRNNHIHPLDADLDNNKGIDFGNVLVSEESIEMINELIDGIIEEISEPEDNIHNNIQDNVMSLKRKREDEEIEDEEIEDEDSDSDYIPDSEDSE